jgi:hypothetical protein
MFYKRLQRVEEHGDEGVDDDDHAGGGGSPPEAREVGAGEHFTWSGGSRLNNSLRATYVR